MRDLEGNSSSMQRAHAFVHELSEALARHSRDACQYQRFSSQHRGLVSSIDVQLAA